MKRLLSLLLVMAMLFGICTVFTACDSYESSQDDEDEDDDKKKDEDEDEDDGPEPTYVLQGLKIVLPDDFTLESEDSYGDSTNVIFQNDLYSVHIVATPMDDEQIQGMSARELRDFTYEMMDPESEDAQVSEADTGKKNGTYYIYAIKDDETMAMAMAFYVDDDFCWQVRILSDEEEEEYDVDDMIELITGWKCRAPEPADTNGDEDEDADTGEDPTGSAVSPPAEPSTPGHTAAGTVIYDNMGVTVTLGEVRPSHIYYTLDLEIENTLDVPVAVSASHFLINGLSTLEGHLYCSAEANSTGTGLLTIQKEQLQMQGIDTIGDISCMVTMYETAEYTTLDEGSPVCIGTEQSGYQHTVDRSGECLFDNGEVRLTAKRMDTNDADVARIHFLLENNTNLDIRVNVDNVVLNGWLLPYTSFSCQLFAGTCAVYTLTLEEASILGIAGIEDLHNLFFCLEAYDAATYRTLFLEDEVSFFPGDPTHIHQLPLEGTVLYDADGIRLMLVDTVESNSCVDFLLYLHNDTDVPLTFSLDNCLINGNESYEGMYLSLPAGCQCIDTLSLWYDESYDFGTYEDLTSLQITLEVYEDYYSSLVLEDIVFPLN